MKKNSKKLAAFGLILPVTLALAFKGLTFALPYFNYSLVFYSPGKFIKIATDSQPEESLPLVEDAEIKNVILFIGDGMGLGQLTAARAHFAGIDGRLNIERMPVTGLLATHAADNLITDSAAAATAMSTGVKTNKGSIGVDADDKSRKTILEAMRDAGFATGLVTNTQLTDATPAAFACHVESRGMKSDISQQLLKAQINVLFGEGEYLYPATDSRSIRTDDFEPLMFARTQGYEVIESTEALLATEAQFALAVFEDLTTDRWQPSIHAPSNPPKLSQLTEKALELLHRNATGFFLMVESEGIDMGGHANRPDYMLHYLRELDEAVKIGVDFARHDGHTLVIVTADHETGGMNLIGGKPQEERMQLVWDTDRHTGQPVPLFAFGPHALRFTGMKDNTELPKLLAELLRLKNFSN